MQARKPGIFYRTTAQYTLDEDQQPDVEDPLSTIEDLEKYFDEVTPQRSPSPAGTSTTNTTLPLPLPHPNFPSIGGDWNARFLAALCLPEDSFTAQKHKYERLVRISVDFVDAATTYGRTIIAELFLPEEEKSIHDAKYVGGMAGGMKYVQRGILFKLAVDVALVRGEVSYLYGGAEPSIELACKAAGHELIGANNFFKFYNRGICVPMQALVDYQGFRLIAMPILPIDSSQPPIYGSADSGRSVWASDLGFNDLMREAAQQLHLSEHFVCKAALCTAGDVEAHMGTDGNRYLIDLARVFPPESPADCRHLPRSPCSVFFRQLRPEFLQYLKEDLKDYGGEGQGFPALSSDSFTEWGRQDRHVHDRNAAEATRHLMEVRLPKFCEFLAGLPRRALTDISLRSEFHRWGVNLRHLGLVRHRIPRAKNLIRCVLLTEILSRTLKSMLRERLRAVQANAAPGMKFPSQYDIRTTVVDFCNLVSCAAKPPDLLRDFWGRELPNNVVQRFGSLAMDPTEDSVVYRGRVDDVCKLPVLVSSLMGSLGVVLSPSCMQAFSERPRGFQFVIADIENIRPKVKTLSVIDFCHGKLLALLCGGNQEAEEVSADAEVSVGVASGGAHSTRSIPSNDDDSFRTRTPSPPLPSPRVTIPIRQNSVEKAAEVDEKAVGPPPPDAFVISPLSDQQLAYPLIQPAQVSRVLGVALSKFEASLSSDARYSECLNLERATKARVNPHAPSVDAIMLKSISQAWEFGDRAQIGDLFAEVLAIWIRDRHPPTFSKMEIFVWFKRLPSLEVCMELLHWMRELHVAKTSVLAGAFGVLAIAVQTRVQEALAGLTSRRGDQVDRARVIVDRVVSIVCKWDDFVLDLGNTYSLVECAELHQWDVMANVAKLESYALSYCVAGLLSRSSSPSMTRRAEELVLELSGKPLHAVLDANKDLLMHSLGRHSIVRSYDSLARPRIRLPSLRVLGAVEHAFHISHLLGGSNRSGRRYARPSHPTMVSSMFFAPVDAESLPLRLTDEEEEALGLLGLQSLKIAYGEASYCVQLLSRCVGTLERIELTDCFLTESFGDCLQEEATRLVSLSLEACTGVTLTSVVLCALGVPSLVELSLVAIDVGVVWIDQKSDSSETKRSVRGQASPLRSSGTLLRQGSLRSLTLKNLKDLTAAHCEFTLVSFPLLTCLRIESSVQLDDTTVGLLSRLRNLSDLTLFRSHLSDAGLETLSNLGIPSLTAIDLGGLPTKVVSDRAIAGVVLAYPLLRSIDLAFNEQVASETFVAIRQSCRTLEVLKLTKCRALGTEAIVELCSSFSESLRVLSLTADKVHFKAIEAMGKCRHIEDFEVMQSKKLSDGNLKYLLRRFTKLKKLTLSKCFKLTDAALQQIGQMCSLTLDELCLSSSRFTDDGIAALGAATNLRRLELSHCSEITGKAVVSLARDSSRLGTICIKFCSQVDDVAIQDLRFMVGVVEYRTFAGMHRDNSSGSLQDLPLLRQQSSFEGSVDSQQGLGGAAADSADGDDKDESDPAGNLEIAEADDEAL